MYLVLKHRDVETCEFEYSDEEVKYMRVLNAEHLPLPLKRIVHYDYFEGGSIVNEEGRYLLEEWIDDRSVPANRINKKAYGYKISDMLKMYGASFTDNYWMENKGLHWKDISLYENCELDTFDVISRDKYSKVNNTLGGTLEKYWFKSGNNLMLAKRTPVSSDMLNIREVIASEIYRIQGYKNYCQYKLIRNRYGQIVGCICKAFTSEDKELITAYDLLAEYGWQHRDNLYELIVDRAIQYGGDKKEITEMLDIMTVVDYLITNRDRHQNNIGFIRDPVTLKILGVAPIFDNGSSIEMEGQLPLGVGNTEVHNLCNTEKECLDSVTDRNCIDINKLPAVEWVRTMWDQSSNNLRDERYAGLYDKKIAYWELLSRHLK